MGASPELLVVRHGDLIQLGLSWIGFDLHTETTTGLSRLTASSDNAKVTIIFPPQAIAEEKADGLNAGLRDARIAGISRVSFSIRRGQFFDLTAEGLLAVLSGAVVLTKDADDTAIEIPWHLTVSLSAQSANISVVASHSAQAITSPSSVVGLWRTRLRAGNGKDRDARLLLRPIARMDVEAGIDTAPLSHADRQAIRDEAERTGDLPESSRMELSTLGGSLSARALWPAFSWNQDISLGRETHVRVQSKGVLYPFGHRAEFVQVADRVFNPPQTASQPVIPATASLQRRSLLVVTEPIRYEDQNDLLSTRQFPFAHVEMCDLQFPDLQSPDWKTHNRHSPATEGLQEKLDGLTQQIQPLTEALQAILDSQPRTFDEYMASDKGSVPSLVGAQKAAEAAATELGNLVQAQSDIDRQIDLLNPETDQAEIQALIAIRPTNQQIQQAQENSNVAQAEANGLLVTVQNEFDALPRTFANLEQQGNQTALDRLTIQHEITKVSTEIADIAAEEQIPRNLFFVPHRHDLPIRFPVRCAGTEGDVFFAVPLIFVEDFLLDSSEHFPAFVSLTDPEVAKQLKEAWEPHSHVSLPSTRIDMVRSSNSQPGDVHEVHELKLGGSTSAGSYRIAVVQMGVEIPALRALVPDAISRVALQYSQDFLQRGDAVEIALESPTPAQAMGIDFTREPRLSGGLAAPKYIADSISRLRGPVAKAALPATGVPDLDSIYKDATLLGFPLSSLIALDKSPLPPSIIPLTENGLPSGVRMEWRDLELRSHDIFQVNNTSTLQLSVETSPTNSKIGCTVSSFNLVLPNPNAKLLTLSFGSIVFTQQAGRDPDLRINGFDVIFSGSLNFLVKLQLALQPLLGGAAPTVRVSRSGIQAGFTLAIPSVTAVGFLLRNIAVSLAVDVPFERKPVTVSLGFASRENPFNLTVLLFGGGGYIEIQVGGTGLMRLEASLEFGASIGISFGIASAEAHAMGGISFIKQTNGQIEVGGFIRIGGSVDVLGLVSVSVELLVTLKYKTETNALEGRATLVIEIDLLFINESVTIDSGVWRVDGGDVPLLDEEEGPISPRLADPLSVSMLSPTEWQQYIEAFAQ